MCGCVKAIALSVLMSRPDDDDSRDGRYSNRMCVCQHTFLARMPALSGMSAELRMAAACEGGRDRVW